MPLARRHGFTLVEVMVALLVAGTVVLVGQQGIHHIGNTLRRLEIERRGHDTDQHARRWLESLLGSMEVDHLANAPFDGAETGLRFTTWVLAADGWMERRTVQVGRRGSDVTATLGNGTTISLFDDVAEVHFDYLRQLGEHAPWLMRWSSRVTAPRAVRLRVHRDGGRADTLIVIVGDRG